MTNQYWSIYYAKDLVLVPTSVKSSVGVRMTVDPMEIVHVNSRAELRHAISSIIAKGNPIVSHPSQEEMSKITIHKKLGFNSYKEFNHTAILWAIGLMNNVYEIEFWKVPENGRGYVSDPTKTINFPAGTTTETVVDKLIDIIQETHRQKMIEGNKE